jgi:hypothetical protein
MTIHNSVSNSTYTLLDFTQTRLTHFFLVSILQSKMEIVYKTHLWYHNYNNLVKHLHK